jgi:alpha-beta hydrolase superfamily lysophospholipase
MGGATILECLLNQPKESPKINGVILCSAAIELLSKPNYVFQSIFRYLAYN